MNDLEHDTKQFASTYHAIRLLAMSVRNPDDVPLEVATLLSDSTTEFTIDLVQMMCHEIQMYFAFNADLAEFGNYLLEDFNLMWDDCSSQEYRDAIEAGLVEAVR